MKQILTCHEILQDFLKLVKTLKSQGKIQTQTQKHPHKRTRSLTVTKRILMPSPQKNIFPKVCLQGFRHHFWLISWTDLKLVVF